MTGAGGGGGVGARGAALYDIRGNLPTLAASSVLQPPSERALLDRFAGAELA